MKTNAKGHLANKMPKNSTLEKRIQCHIEHTKNCKCRPMNPKIQKGIKKKNILTTTLP